MILDATSPLATTGTNAPTCGRSEQLSPLLKLPTEILVDIFVHTLGQKNPRDAARDTASLAIAHPLLNAALAAPNIRDDYQMLGSYIYGVNACEKVQIKTSLAPILSCLYPVLSKATQQSLFRESKEWLDEILQKEKKGPLSHTFKNTQYLNILHHDSDALGERFFDVLRIAPDVTNGAIFSHGIKKLNSTARRQLSDRIYNDRFLSAAMVRTDPDCLTSQECNEIFMRPYELKIEKRQDCGPSVPEFTYNCFEKLSCQSKDALYHLFSKDCECPSHTKFLLQLLGRNGNLADQQKNAIFTFFRRQTKIGLVPSPNYFEIESLIEDISKEDRKIFYNFMTTDLRASVSFDLTLLFSAMVLHKLAGDDAQDDFGHFIAESLEGHLNAYNAFTIENILLLSEFNELDESYQNIIDQIILKKTEIVHKSIDIFCAEGFPSQTDYKVFRVYAQALSHYIDQTKAKNLFIHSLKPSHLAYGIYERLWCLTKRSLNELFTDLIQDGKNDTRPAILAAFAQRSASLSDENIDAVYDIASKNGKIGLMSDLRAYNQELFKSHRRINPIHRREIAMRLILENTQTDEHLSHERLKHLVEILTHNLQPE